MTHARYIVLGALCLAASISYICRLSISVAESTIREEFGVSKDAIALVMTLFFLPYALGQIPGAMLVERWGCRRALPWFAAGWSLATAAVCFSTALPWLVGAWLVNGLFQAGLFPGCARTISRWFPPDRRAFASGTLASFMSLGGAIGSAAMGFLLEVLGWRMAFPIFGSLGLLWASGFAVWFRDDPARHPAVSPAELAVIRGPTGGEPPASADPAAAARPSAVWLALLFSPATWCICGQQFCRAAGQGFFGSWFATYLQEARGMSISQSGVFNSLPLIALILGAFAGGATSDWILSRTGSRRLARQGVAATCMFLCAAFVLAAYFVQHPIYAVLMISAGTFLAAVGGPSAYAITIDMGGDHLAKLFSCMNMIGNLGTVCFILGVPQFLRLTQSWDTVLLCFGVLWVGAGLCWLLLNPNGDIFQQSFWRGIRH
ncbi:MAG: MFS transporter [Pirellulaceae bacterium]